MLPRFPDRLRPIDAALLSDHSQLTSQDECDFLWEYVPRRPADWTAGNQFIRDLKLKDSQLAHQPARLRYKRAAIAHAGRALRRLLPQEWLSQATFVPMPCSKTQGGCDHDDRMLRVLRCAFRGRGADIRELLRMDYSLCADHESRARCSAARLRRALCVGSPARSIAGVRDTAVEPAPRPLIILVDDVLNSGKHYRVASRVLQERWPDRQVRGLFLARCVRARR